MSMSRESGTKSLRTKSHKTNSHNMKSGQNPTIWKLNNKILYKIVEIILLNLWTRPLISMYWVYLCPSNLSLKFTLFCRFRSHSLHNLFTHSTSYSVFTSVFVTDSQYHECICRRLTVSRVYLFCNAILAEREEARWLTNQVLSD